MRENLAYLLTENEESIDWRLRTILDFVTKEKVSIMPDRHTKRMNTSSIRHKINIKYDYSTTPIYLKLEYYSVKL